MDPSLITEKELQKRIDNLPSNLRAISMSENAIENLRKICRAHHLDDERTLIMEHIVGLIILGFISLDELNVEISRSLRMNIQHANDIAVEVDRKIFAPIRDEIKKNYSPILESITPSRESARTPQIEKKLNGNIIETPLKYNGDKIGIIEPPKPKIEPPLEPAIKGMPKIIKATEILEQITKSAPPIREPMRIEKKINGNTIETPLKYDRNTIEIQKKTEIPKLNRRNNR